MRTIDELGTSPTPWNNRSDRIYPSVDDAQGFEVAELSDNDSNARLIAAAPELYEALFDCCEEVNEHDAPRCYGCRRGADGHCMARESCAIYKTLSKASGEEAK